VNSIPHCRCFASSFLFFVLLIAARDVSAQSTSPGPLAHAHASIDGEGQCRRCHGEDGRISAQACMTCHARMEGSRFHRRLVSDSGKGCADCHPDHRGRRALLVRFTPPPEFDHGETGRTLVGSHKSIACRKCHTRANRWLDAKTECIGCHEDKHQPSLGVHCEACHGEDKFKGADRFDHTRGGGAGRARYLLDGKHRDAPCEKCHTSRGIQGRWRGLTFGKCDDCHRDPHAGKMGSPTCASCHVTTGWKDISKDAVRTHSRFGFPLEQRHIIPCAKCHGPKIDKKVESRCDACHKQPHQNRFGMRCGDCHDAHAWALRPGARFDASTHDKTRYKLEGGHQPVRCVKCHESGKGYANRWQLAHQPEDKRCVVCHKDPHGGPFRSVERGDRCETCHDLKGFTPSTYALESHDRTRFKLEGGHVMTPCAKCHTRPQPPQPKAAAPRLRDTPLRCHACHADVHRGQFGGFDMPGEGGTCERCHVTERFKTLRFDHQKTKFPLSDKHAATNCASCHAPATPGAVVRWSGLRRECASCHADVHLGQFESRGPVRTCESCHTGAATFKRPGFDHRKETAWALDGKHARVKCEACHVEVPADSVRRVRLWRLGPLACEACHANPHARPDGGAR